MTDTELAEFLDALDRYGGNLELWPEAARRQAHALIAKSGEARSQLGTLQRAERALARTRPLSAPGIDIVTLAASRHRQERPRQLSSRRLSFAAAATFALAAGIYVGMAPVQSDKPSQFVALALDDAGSRDVW